MYGWETEQVTSEKKQTMGLELADTGARVLCSNHVANVYDAFASYMHRSAARHQTLIASHAHVADKGKYLTKL